MRVPLETPLPRLIAQSSPNAEAGVVLEEIDARMCDAFASQDLDEISITIVEYGFSPLLTIPVIMVWAGHVPDCLRNLRIPTILRHYNLSLASKGGISTGITAGAGPPPPPPPLLPAEQAHNIKLRSRGLPEKANSPARNSALGYIYGDAKTSSEMSKRLHNFRLTPAPFDGRPWVPLGHGSNISSVYDEKRGSLGVFLAPHSRPGECHFLSAEHVFGGPHRSQVQTVSHLDMLRQLVEIVYNRSSSTIAEQEAGCELVFQRVKLNVGELIASSIGVDATGWRKDWALCHVPNEYAGVNGSFDMDQEDSLRQLLGLDADHAFRGGLGLSTAKGGDTVVKIGATTGITIGIVNETSLYTYRRGKAEPATSGDIPYDRATLRLIVSQLPSQTSFCAGGDSGSGVFAFGDGGLSWVGLLVGIDHAGETGFPVLHGDIGLMIPQEIVFSQIEKETGTEWGLYHAPPAGGIS